MGAGRERALLFQGATSLAWFDLKTQTSRGLVSGKERIADRRSRRMGKYVSFVRNHNLWLVSVRMEKSALHEGGTEEVAQGELDWVVSGRTGDYYGVLGGRRISSAIAYFQMENESRGGEVSAGGIFFADR